MKQDIWAEGKWIDFWTLNHLLSGIVAGSLLFILGISLGWSLIIVTTLFIGWELVEYVFKIENLTNQIVDMAANYLGYGIFYIFYYILESPFQSFTVVILTILFVSLETWGFIAWLKSKGKL